MKTDLPIPKLVALYGTILLDILPDLLMLVRAAELARQRPGTIIYIVEAPE